MRKLSVELTDQLKDLEKLSKFQNPKIRKKAQCIMNYGKLVLTNAENIKLKHTNS